MVRDTFSRIPLRNFNFTQFIFVTPYTLSHARAPQSSPRVVKTSSGINILNRAPDKCITTPRTYNRAKHSLSLRADNLKFHGRRVSAAAARNSAVGDTCNEISPLIIHASFFTGARVQALLREKKFHRGM